MNITEYLKLNISNPLELPICEAEDEASGAFNIRTSDIQELLDNIPGLDVYKDGSHEQILKSFLTDLAGTHPGEEMIMAYSVKSNHFKIPYEYYDDIKSLVTGKYSDTLAIKSDDVNFTKVKVGFLRDGKVSRREVFETGRGSKTVTTAQQERATCVIWNAFVDTINKGDGKQFDIDNMDLLKSIVIDISDKFDNGWIKTFQKQVKLITSYLESISVKPENYLMDRAGEGRIGVAYGKFIASYSRALGGRKDNFDPSDSVIFDKNNTEKIESWFLSAASKLNGMNFKKDELKIAGIKKDYFNTMFKSKQFIGISLKKIMGAQNAGSYELFNETEESTDNKVRRVTDFEISHTPSATARYIMVTCSGDFNFGGITDGGAIIGKEKSINLVLRSFGSDIIAMDTKLKRGPSLGKCPVRVWSNAINADNTKDLDDCLDTFTKWLNNTPDNDIKKALKLIIQGSIKEGGKCLPFVLLH